MQKYLLLTAKKHNWYMIGPGDWTVVSWRIFSDKSYRITISFMKDHGSIEKAFEMELMRKRRNIHNYKRQSGVMSVDQFEKLKEVLDKESWRDPKLRIDACDGEAWEICHYSSEGELLRSSGPLGYIYGEEVLETIVSCLPEVNESFFAPAFVAVSREG